jgi:hypothetical protein
MIQSEDGEISTFHGYSDCNYDIDEIGFHHSAVFIIRLIGFPDALNLGYGEVLKEEVVYK